MQTDCAGCGVFFIYICIYIMAIVHKNFILLNVLPYEFFMFSRKSWRKFHRCVFSVKEGTELLVCLKINYKHQIVLRKMIVAHLLGEFIAFFYYKFITPRHGALS